MSVLMDDRQRKTARIFLGEFSETRKGFLFGRRIEMYLGHASILYTLCFEDTEKIEENNSMNVRK